MGRQRFRPGASGAGTLFIILMAAEPCAAGHWSKDDMFPDRAMRIRRPSERNMDFISLAAADFNGDGRVDFAGPMLYADVALVAQGWQDWTWWSWGTVNRDQEWADSAVGDFDGDGLPDLVVEEARVMLLFFGDREKGFAPVPDLVPWPETAIAIIAVDDFDRDGRADIALLRKNIQSGEDVAEIIALLGCADRTFISRSSGPFQCLWPYSTTASTTMTSADFDGDGAGDLAMLVQAGQDAPFRLVILAGKGDGTFRPLADKILEGPARGLAAGDVNGDGRQDLVLLEGARRVSVLLGKGDGSFATAWQAEGGLRPSRIACADLNRDGKSDLLVYNSDATLYSFLADGTGAMELAGTFLAGGTPGRETIADIDGDGHLDVSLYDPMGLIVLRGTGDGAFIAAPALAAFVDIGLDPFPWECTFPLRRGALAVEDIDGDRRPDILWLRGGAGVVTELAVASGRGDGTFSAPRALRVGDGPLYWGYTFTIADVNGDGIKDVLIADPGDRYSNVERGLSVFLGDGAGSFGAGRMFAAGGEPIALAVGRFDADSILDVAVANRNGQLALLLGNGDGSFRHEKTFALGKYPTIPVVADLDGDGQLDIACTSEEEPITFWALFGDGRGGFEVRSYPSRPGLAFRGSVFLVGGWGPLLFRDDEGLRSFFFTGRELASGGLALARRGDDPSTAFADLNGDGAEEILFAGNEELEVMSCCGMPEEETLISPAARESSDIAVADLDGNGMPDVVTLGTALVVHRNRLKLHFIRGDSTGDGSVDITDPIDILEYLFVNPPVVGCPDALDANGDREVDISDPVFLLFHLFLAGTPPPAPFPFCGWAEGPGIGCGAMSYFCR